MSYREWMKTIGPGWTMDINGQAFDGETGGILDDQRDRLLQGALARFPTKGALDSNGKHVLPASDSLDNIGADRQLPRGPGEADAVLGPRLQAAWDQWPFAGAHYGILRALNIAGYANMVIVQQNGRWAKLNGSSGTIADLQLGSLMACVTRSNHPGWMFDTRDAFWALFGIVFTADATNLQTAPPQAILNRIVTQWEPVRRFVGSWVILAGTVLGWPTGRALGAVPALGGNSMRFIPGDGSPAFVVGP